MKKRLFLVAVLLLIAVLTSCGNGKEIIIHTGSPTSCQTSESTAAPLPDGEGLMVLINKNSKVFHLASDCIYASRMSEENRLEIKVESVEYLLEHGYTPCGKCSGEYKQTNSEE